MPAWFRAGSIVSLLLCSASGVSAQATLSGIVRNDSTGAPIPGVEVILNGTPHAGTTNAQGRYLITGLPTGTYQLIFRLVGHLPLRIDVRLTAGDTTRANAMLIPSTVVLAPVIVTGAPSTRGVGIGREAIVERQRLGFGRFVDAEKLRRYESFLNVDNVLEREGDVVIMKRGHEYVAFNRTRRDINGKPNCVMQVYYNGSPVGKGGVVGASDLRPANLRDFSVSGLEDVEIYRSAAEVPLEYGGPNAGCGVILLWSRVNP